jgi:diacylglycerol kinase family enzyme
MPTIAARVLGERFRPADHRQIDHYEDVTSARLASISLDEGGRARSFPLQVDGDYIGDYADVELGIEPGALTVVA